MAEQWATCGQCYNFNWKTLLHPKPEPPECRIKARLGWVFETDPVCSLFEPKPIRRTDNGN